MKQVLKRFWSDETGATAIEYGLIVSLVSIAIIVSLGSLGITVSGFFETVATVLANHASA